MVVPSLVLYLLLSSATDSSTAIGLYNAGRYEDAARAFARIVEEKAPPSLAAHALFLLANIQVAQAESTQATSTLEQLVSAYPDSPWALSALSMLADRAAAARDWGRASGFVSRFVELYAHQPYAAIDDRLNRQMFSRLVEYAQQQDPGKPVRQIHRELRVKYSSALTTGRLVEFLAPDDPQGNLVVNGDFELDGRTVGTPVGWSYVGTEPNLQDDLDGVLETGGLIKAHNGRFCAGKFTNWDKHQGWLYQRVPVVPDHRYAVSVYALTPASKSQPGRVRLGVDLGGGTNPQADRVRWTEPLSATESYHKLAFEGQEAVTAEEPALTVFLEIRQDQPTEPNAMLFDDVSVRRAD